jgi:septal ring factor EnvC (AmiA/AmiB activator)
MVTLEDLKSEMRALHDASHTAKQSVVDSIGSESIEMTQLRAQCADLEGQLNMSCDENNELREKLAAADEALRTLREQYDARFRETAMLAASTEELAMHVRAISLMQGEICAFMSARQRTSALTSGLASRGSRSTTGGSAGGTSRGSGSTAGTSGSGSGSGSDNDNY